MTEYMEIYDCVEGINVEVEVIEKRVLEEGDTWATTWCHVRHEPSGCEFAVVDYYKGHGNESWMMCQADWQGELALPDSGKDYEWVECTPRRD